MRYYHIAIRADTINRGFPCPYAACRLASAKIPAALASASSNAKPHLNLLC